MRISFPTITERHSAPRSSKNLVLLTLSITTVWYASSEQVYIRIEASSSAANNTTPSELMSSYSDKRDIQEVNNDTNKTGNDISLYSFSYRVHGVVQGVYFRKYTQQKATELGLGGWIRNDKSTGTVEGQVICSSSRRGKTANEASVRSICNHMKAWLQTEGSPRSQIDHAYFQTLNEKEVQALWRDLGNSSSKPAYFEIHKTVGSKNMRTDVE